MLEVTADRRSRLQILRGNLGTILDIWIFTRGPEQVAVPIRLSTA